MNILGIDPGLATTGWGVIKSKPGKLNVVTYGIIKTEACLPFAKRLEKIYQELKKIIKKYKPQKAALEELYFCKNVKTALKIGQAQGVITLAISQKKIPLCLFTPLQIKQGLSGYGRASKSQIQKMLKIILGLKEIPKPDDAADALAVAYCGALNKSRTFPLGY